MKKIAIILAVESSHPALDSYINRLSEEESQEVIVTRMPNGKGRAHLDALRRFQQEYNTEDYVGVLLLDADQLLPVKEVAKLTQSVRQNPDAIHIGSRTQLTHSDSVQTKVTRKLFKFFYGVSLNDIQSPYQAIPVAQIPTVLKTVKHTSNWDTRLLTKMAIQKVPIKEVAVQLEEEKPEPKISFRLYIVLFSVFLKYSLASFSSFLVDILFFQLFLFLTRNFDAQTRIILSTIGARIVSSMYNFLVNNFIVFKNKKQQKQQWMKYYGLVVFEMLMSSFLVAGFYGLTGWNETFLKILVDGGLFFLGYYIEKHYIF